MAELTYLDHAASTPMRPEAVAASLLGAAFVVMAALLLQAVATVRTHERVVTATLEDFAGFAGLAVANWFAG